MVAAANRGEAEAMETLYFRYRDWAYSLAWRFCRNREDALDVLQDVFAYFFNKFPGFRLTSKLKTFLYPVIKNTSLILVRKHRRLVPLDESFAKSLSDERPHFELERKKLDEWLEGVDQQDRELVLLRFYDGFSLQEIGRILKIPLGTVKSRLHRALARLRENISE